jgi:hypothetical protein
MILPKITVSILPFFALVTLSCGQSQSPDVVEEVTCEQPIDSVPRSPLRRLNHTEISHAIHDLLPDLDIPHLNTGVPLSEDGFENDHAALQATEVFVERMEQFAYALSIQIAENWTPTEHWHLSLGTVLEHAYRRPVPLEEQAKWTAFADHLNQTQPPHIAQALWYQALLQSPSFLYRIEEGTPLPNQPGVQQLDDWSIASRLSFLLWQRPPDAALRQDAAQGLLQDPDIREAHMRRLLTDPKSEPPLRAFVRQWLGLSLTKEVNKDPATFPNFDQELWVMMQEETERFGADILRNHEGGYDALMESSHTFATPELAEIYGVKHSMTETWERISLPPEQRAGLLTHGSFLAGQGNEIHPNPIRRSIHVMSRMMCCEPMRPPQCLDTAELTAVPQGGPSTNRERYKEKVSEGYCASCHQRINPMGFVFEGYDAVGAFRTHDGGIPVDASGGIRVERSESDIQDLCANLVPTDSDGDAVGAVEMASLLSGSDVFGQCLIQNYTRYASGHALNPKEECVSNKTYSESSTQGRTLTAVLSSWVRSPAFTQRRWEE